MIRVHLSWRFLHEGVSISQIFSLIYSVFRFFKHMLLIWGWLLIEFFGGIGIFSNNRRLFLFVKDITVFYLNDLKKQLNYIISFAGLPLENYTFLWVTIFSKIQTTYCLYRYLHRYKAWIIYHQIVSLLVLNGFYYFVQNFLFYSAWNFHHRLFGKDLEHFE